MVVKNNKSSRYNIISYKGLLRIYIYDKIEDNPYYINHDYGFYGSHKEKINKGREINITKNTINKFITKKTYDFPEYLVLY